MQNLKRVLSLVLVVAMVMSFMISASAATAEQLVDLNESNFQPEVRVLAALNIVEGYEDNTYKPANEVTRAELATILARVRVGGDKEMINTYNYGHMTYTDVLNNGYIWAAPAIQYATDNGMVVGDGNGLYRPGDTVTVVEGLKMLLTALGYDAEIEGLQNVGAAWKANVLSLAREVGLMDRFYGDTNKNMTRDDMALLIYNFLMSDVVKGYYENDVANVDTIMYFGGTALEIYFGKQVVYGAIVANEKANLDVYVDNSDNAYDNAYNRLDEGYTQLFLYDNEDGVTLAEAKDMSNTPNRRGGKVKDDYFMTFKGLSTDLGDIGESVFVITDLEPTKGTYVAIGGTCFETGVNEIGVEQWSEVNTRGLTTNDTLYFNDYNEVAANTLDDHGNGDFHKTVDFDGDGKLDLVMVENWAMASAYGTDKKGNVLSTADSSWNWNIYGCDNKGTLMDAEFVTMGYINFHFADGIWYSTAAEVIEKTGLTDDIDAINYKYGYVTLADGNKYYQSDVYVGVKDEFVPGMMTDLMDCEKDPKSTSNYNWVLDNGGYVRAYGVDTSHLSVYLLTDASSILTRTGYNLGVDALQKADYTDGMANYALGNYWKYQNFVKCGNADATYGALVPAIANESITNLVKASTSDSVLTAENAGTIVDLNSTVGKQGNHYSLKSDLGDWGNYNTETGLAADGLVDVYTTDTTDYYIVITAESRTGDTYVRDVKYVQGYKNLKNVDFSNCSASYALVSATDANGDWEPDYYTANTVVFETDATVTATEYPYFAYEHLSSKTDAYTGRFATISPAGVVGTTDIVKFENPYISDWTNSLLGFFIYDTELNTAVAINEDFGDYGIHSGTVKAVLNSYYVLEEIGGTHQIEVENDVELHALVKAYPDKNHGDEPYWAVCEDYTGLNVGDEVIYVTDVKGNVQYVLAIDGDDNWLPMWTYFSDSPELWALWNAIEGNTNLREAKYAAFKDAVNNYVDNKDIDTYDAMLTALDAAIDEYNKTLTGTEVAVTDANFSTMVWGASGYYIDVLEAAYQSWNELLNLKNAIAAVQEGANVIVTEAGMKAINDAYNLLTNVEKAFLNEWAEAELRADIADYAKFYEENYTAIDYAKALTNANAKYANAGVVEQPLVIDDVAAALKNWLEVSARTNWIVGANNNEVTTAIDNIAASEVSSLKIKWSYDSNWADVDSDSAKTYFNTYYNEWKADNTASWTGDYIAEFTVNEVVVTIVLAK